MFEYQRGGFALRVADHIKQLDNVSTATHILKNFDLAFDLLLLDGFQDFNDTTTVGGDVGSLKDFGIFATSDFAYYLVIFLIAPIDGEGFVVPIITWTMDIDVGVDSRSTHDFSLGAAASFLLFLEILTTDAAATDLTKNGRRRKATIPIVEAMVN